MCVSRQYRCVHARSIVYVRSGHPFITRITGVPFGTDFKPIIMAEDNACLVVFAKRGELSEDMLNAVFAFLVVDPQTICTIQRTCCTFRHWNYDTLHQWKLDWVYKNVEEVLGARRTNQLRDGSLTSIYLRYTIIGAEGGKAIGEALKVNNSLTQVYLERSNIGVEGEKAIGEALKVNTSLTSIYLLENK